MISLDKVVTDGLEQAKRRWSLDLFLQALADISQCPELVLDWDDGAGEDVARFEDNAGQAVLLFKKIPIIFVRTDILEKVEHSVQRFGLGVVLYQTYDERRFTLRTELMSAISEPHTSHFSEMELSAGDMYYYCV